MKRFVTLASTASLGMALALFGLPAYSADGTDSDDEGQDGGSGYIEEIVVTGEWGETNVLRANWRSADSAWRVTAFVQNALDQAALHMWSPREGIGSPFGTIVERREIGIQVGWQFQQDE